MQTVIIAGCGFGGIDVAVSLKKQRPDLHVIAINREAYHTLNGELPELISRKICHQDINVPLEPYFHVFGVEFIQDEILAISHEQKTVTTKEHGIQSFDYLLLDLGSVHHDFGIPGVKEHAFTVKPVYKSLELSSHIEKLFKDFHNMSPQEQKTAMRFVVGGGGLSGVEIIAEIVDYTLYLAKEYHVPQYLLEWYIVDANKHLGQQFGNMAVNGLKKYLLHRGVRLVTDTKIEQVGTSMMVTNKGTIHSQTIVFVGGFKPHPLIKEVGLPTDKRGALLVNRFLQSTQCPYVFATGDNACIENNPREQTALIAVLEEPTVVENIKKAIEGQPLTPFKANKNYAYYITLGNNDAMWTYGKFALVHPWFYRLKKKIHGGYARKYFDALDPQKRPALMKQANTIRFG